MKTITKTYHSLHQLPKAGILLLALMCSSLGWTNDDRPIRLGSLAVSKQFGDYTVFGAGGLIKGTIEGELVSTGVVGKINQQFYWQAEYFGLFTDIPNGGTKHDNRARTTLTYVKAFDTWRFSVRPLLEYRNSETLNGFRLRPQLALFYPLTIKEQKITPSFKIEPFYVEKQREFTFTLIYFGAEWSIHPKLALSAEYVRIIDHINTTDIEGPALTLKVRL